MSQPHPSNHPLHKQNLSTLDTLLWVRNQIDGLSTSCQELESSILTVKLEYKTCKEIVHTLDSMKDKFTNISKFISEMEER